MIELADYQGKGGRYCFDLWHGTCSGGATSDSTGIGPTLNLTSSQVPLSGTTTHAVPCKN